MGRGDKKSKRGKIAIGSYGNTRRKKKRVPVIKRPSVAEAAAGEEQVVAKPRKTARKKAES
ncbi:MAG TPA: 30S ribosomal protein THX [Cyclobacteriaceae bacterium]|nr:30S ribosomal protein THX [Cyclobacteriaceae bacterium]